MSWKCRSVCGICLVDFIRAFIVRCHGTFCYFGCFSWMAFFEIVPRLVGERGTWGKKYWWEPFENARPLVLWPYLHLPWTAWGGKWRRTGEEPLAFTGEGQQRGLLGALLLVSVLRTCWYEGKADGLRIVCQGKYCGRRTTGSYARRASVLEHSVLKSLVLQ